MAFNNLESRTDVAATIPEQFSAAIMQGVQYESAAMRLFRRVPMGTNQTRMPVLSALPVAYFVTGDTGMKQTTEMAWKNRYLNAEEIAAIVPIPENVVDDMTYNIYDEAQPLLVEAIGRALDAAIFFGANKPASWPLDIASGCVAAGATIARNTHAAATGGIAGDIGDAMAAVEASGFPVTGFVTNLTYNKYFRSARDIQGQRLLDFGAPNPGATGDQPYALIEGMPVYHAMEGLWPTGSGAAELFAGYWQEGILGVRKDITWKMADQGIIQDGSGAILFNLFQQDMVAIRVTARFAWQVSNRITWQQPVEGSRWPWALVKAP